MMVGIQNMSSHSPTGRVLVVIPCLNEEQHIEQVVSHLAAEAERLDLRIVVADGGSTDQTRAIVERLSTNCRVVLMINSGRIQATGINDAVSKYGKDARFLIRVDAHASYPENYCETLLNVQSRTLADSVVVSMLTEGFTCIQRAVAAAQNSILGNGGSAHRNQTADRWVDHGHHALIKMDAFKAIGGYDDTFSHNEDAELDNRLTDAGFRIFLTAEVQVIYYPRGSVTGVFQQYFNIGRGRARNFLKHPKRAKLRHLVLGLVAPAICLMLLTPLMHIFAVPAATWALACITYGLMLGMRLRDPCAMASGVAAMAMQAGWSFGFFRGLLSNLSAKPMADNERRTQSCNTEPNSTSQKELYINGSDTKVTS
jgi:succinoglycan biosynthesis protein ExoA